MSEINLLVVEPSHTMRLVIQYSLERLPVRLFFAKNSEEALSIINPQFDVALCSSRLPSEDGYAFCGILKGKSPHLKTILLMQKNEIYDFGRGGVFHIEAQIEKPFLSQQLVELVCQLIGSPAPNAQAYQVFNRVIPLKQPGSKTKTPTQATVSEIFQLTATPTPAPIAREYQQVQVPENLSQHADQSLKQASEQAPQIKVPTFDQVPPKAKPMDQRTLIGFSSAEELKALFPKPEELNNTPPQPIEAVSNTYQEEDIPPIYQSIPPPPPPPVIEEEDIPPPPQPSIYTQKSNAYQAISFDPIEEEAFEPATSFGYVPASEQKPTVSNMPALNREMLNRDLMPTVSPPKIVVPDIDEAPLAEAPLAEAPLVEAPLVEAPLVEAPLDNQQILIANVTPEFDAELMEDDSEASEYQSFEHQSFEHQSSDASVNTQTNPSSDIHSYAHRFLDHSQKRLSDALYARIAQNLGLDPNQNEAELQQILNQMIWQILPDLAEAVIKEELSKLLAPKNQFN